MLFTSKGSHIVSFRKLICELPQDPQENCTKIVFWQTISYFTSFIPDCSLLGFVYCICDVLYTAGGHLSSHLYWSPWLCQTAFSLFHHNQKVNKMHPVTMFICSGMKNIAILWAMKCIDYGILIFSVSVLY